MSVWEVVPRKVLRIEDEEIDVSSKSASEVKEMIIQKARERGWSRIEVKINDVPVTPEEFESKFNASEDITIEVTKKDIAG